jgi:DNA-binding response OmpR family regulator
VEFQMDGTAALAAAPFRATRPPPHPAADSVAGPSQPGELGDLVRRLEALVQWLRARDADQQARQVHRFGAVEVDPLALTVRRNGIRVPLTGTEFRLLSVLLRRPGRVVHRDELLAEVWGPGVRHRSRAIDTHVARLRQKLEPDPAHPRHILTAPYRGYRFDPRGGTVPAVSPSPLEALCDLDVVGLCSPPRSA